MTDKKKIHIVNLTDEVKAKLIDYLGSINLEFDLVDSASDADLVIDHPGEREVSKSDHLHAGGRISCPIAFNVADNLGIQRHHIGEMANILDIRIFGCQLGCFK